MKKNVFTSVFIFLSLFSNEAIAQKSSFTLASKDLGNFFSLKQVYHKYNCGGENVSPELYWKNAPKNTKSFAITMFDPDAPTGKGWWHWLAFDIPIQISEFPSGAGSYYAHLLPPVIIQSINDYKEYGYGGPCPPPGKPHRYFISIYALDTVSLGLNKNTPPEIVYKKILKHSLNKAEIMSLYGR